jgi:hypothetical protein
LPDSHVHRPSGSQLEDPGEIKKILPPDVLLKVFAVFMVASVIFALALFKIIQESTVSALLGALAAGVFGFAASRKSDGDA